MADNAGLIEQLRAIVNSGVADYFNAGTPNNGRITEAADALEAAQAQIELLALQRDAALSRLADLEKQDPVGYFFCADDHWQQAHDPLGFPGHTPFYAAAGASPQQPVEQAQPVQPEPAVAWHPTEAAIAALKRFEETCSDGEGYDVLKDMMFDLAAIGLIYKTHGATYCITDFGRHILTNQYADALKPTSWRSKK